LSLQLGCCHLSALEVPILPTAQPRLAARTLSVPSSAAETESNYSLHPLDLRSSFYLQLCEYRNCIRVSWRNSYSIRAAAPRLSLTTRVQPHHLLGLPRPQCRTTRDSSITATTTGRHHRSNTAHLRLRDTRRHSRIMAPREFQRHVA
jgi:hypothetical protein